MRAALLCCLTLTALPAAALELPVQGVFGIDAQDCKAAREHNEGGYVGFADAAIGHGGQGGCDIVALRKTGPDRWALVGRCFDLDGGRKQRTLVLARKGKFEIEYDGQRYRQCAK